MCKLHISPHGGSVAIILHTREEQKLQLNNYKNILLDIEIWWNKCAAHIGHTSAHCPQIYKNPIGQIHHPFSLKKRRCHRSISFTAITNIQPPHAVTITNNICMEDRRFLFMPWSAILDWFALSSVNTYNAKETTYLPNTHCPWQETEMLVIRRNCSSAAHMTGHQKEEMLFKSSLCWI